MPALRVALYARVSSDQQTAKIGGNRHLISVESGR